MDTTEAILTRRTVHEFLTDPVPQEWVEEALAAAIRAPNHKLTNPWRFYQLGPLSREKVVSVAVELKSKNRDLSEAELQRLRGKFGNSPVLVLVSQVLSENPARRREDYASVSCAIQNFCLSLWSRGVSTKWSTGGFMTDARTCELLGVDSRQEEVVGAIFAGYAASSGAPTARRSLEEVYRQIP